jgi:hypothetical protein
MLHSEAGRFSVTPPVELKESVITADMAHGRGAAHLFSGQDRATGYSVKYSDSSVNLEKMVVLDGHPGREITGSGKDAGKDFQFLWRIYLVGHRVYTFLAAAPPGSLDEAAAQAFMQSISLERPPAPVAPGVLKPVGGNFAITPPVPLSESVTVQNSPSGQFVDHIFNGGEDELTYLVEYFDNPALAQADPLAFMKRVAESATKQMGGSMLSEKSITLGNYPGLEYIGTYQKFGCTNTAKCRLFVVGSRFYQVQVSTVGDTPSPLADAFLDTFSITAPPIAPVTHPAAAANASAPVEFQSSVGRFSVMAPAPFREVSQPVNTVDGPGIIHQFIGNAGPRAFVVSYMDQPLARETITPEAHLDQVRDAIISDLHGKAADEKTISASGFPGREFSTTGTAGEQAVSAKVRIFVVGNRLYQVMVIAQLGAELPAAAEAFCNSFQLTPPTDAAH